jgi:antitoxin FitA
MVALCKMATLTIKSIPDTLYARLKAKASENRRSLNSEVIVCLEESVTALKNDHEQTLERIRHLRNSMKGIYLTEDFLRRAKDEGRE